MSISRKAFLMRRIELASIRVRKAVKDKEIDRLKLQRAQREIDKPPPKC
jgi:hypothetical protein